jgi:hypothetical protein
VLPPPKSFFNGEVNIFQIRSSHVFQQVIRY